MSQTATSMWPLATMPVPMAMTSPTPPAEATAPHAREIPEDADIALMLKVRDGDERALAELIERWKNPLLNFFYRSANSRATAEDLAQVTFIRLYRAAPGYKPKARFSTYLFQIARRLLLNEFRRRKRKPADPVDPSELHAVDPGNSARKVAEIEEAFRQALEQLPEKQRSAILLLQQQELDYEEIGRILGARPALIKTWIFRARQHLREALKDLRQDY